MIDFLLMVGGALFAMVVSGIVNYKKIAWVGLTEEEELKLAQDSMGKSRHWLVAQVEAKLKEKNT